MSERTIDRTKAQAHAVRQAFLMSQLVVAGTVAVVSDRLGPLDEASPGRTVLAVVVSALAAVEMVMAWVLPRVVLKRGRPHAGPTAEATPDAQARLRAVFVAYLVRVALLESVLVYGVLVFVLTRDFRAFIPFAAGAFVATAKATFDGMLGGVPHRGTEDG